MTAPKDTSPCAYRDPVGRRCRLPRKAGHPSFCDHHARFFPEGTLEDPQALLTEVVGASPDFRSACTINEILGKLLSLLITRRLPARLVAIGGYLCQLQIQTLPHIERELNLKSPAPLFQFVSCVPRPKYPPPYDHPEGVLEVYEDELEALNEKKPEQQKQ